MSVTLSAASSGGTIRHAGLAGISCDVTSGCRLAESATTL